MRAGRALLVVLAGLVAVAAAGAWLLPGRLDWNRYRPEIERLASTALGRPVHIGGGIALSLMPEPALMAGDLRVEDAGDGVALTARELRLRVALGALIAGRLHPSSMVLEQPELRLPWPPPPGALQARPAWLRSASAEIRDGTLRLGDFALTGIGARFDADPNTGTLAGSGAAELGGHGWRFTARLAQPGRDGAAGFEVSLDGEGLFAGTGGRFSGAIGADGTLAGTVSGRGRNLALLVPAPVVAWQASGGLTAAGGLLVADELALELGGSPARGVVALRVGEGARLDLALAASRLDLDLWLPAIARARPAGLPTGVDLSAEAATLAGGTLRSLRGGFDLAGGGVALRDFSAVLPGDATLALAGAVTPGAQPGPSFRGTARLTAPALRTTLRWAAGALLPGLDGVLPEAALRDAAVTAAVAATPDGVTLSDLRGTLDGARAEGSAGLRLGPRPVVSAALTLDALALDPWLSRPDALLSGYPWPGLAQRFARFGAHLVLHARSAAWAGVALDSFDVDGQFDAQGARLRRFAAEGRGARLALSGSLGDGGRIADGLLDLTAKEGAALRDLLPPGWDERHLLRGPVEVRARASGPPEALALQAELAVGDLRIEAQPLLNLPAGSGAGFVSLRHPGAPRLLGQLGMAASGSWLGDGSLSLTAQANVAPDRVVLRDVVLTAGALRASGTLDADLRARPIRVKGSAASDVLPLPRPDARSPEPLPLGLLRGWNAAVQVQAKEVLFGLQPALWDAAAAVVLQDGTLRLEGVKAAAAGGTLEGTATFEAGADPPRLAVAGHLSGAQIAGSVFGTPLDVTGGSGDVRVALAAAGFSPAALLATLSGEIGASLRDGAVAGFDLAGAGSALTAPDARREGDARAALEGGATAFRALDLAARLREGVATLTAAQLGGPSGTASASGSVDLSANLLDLRLVLHPAEPPEAPPLATSISGAAAAPQRTADLAELVRWSLAQQPTR